MPQIRLIEVLRMEDQGEHKNGEAIFFDIMTESGTIVGSCSLRLWHDRETHYGGNIGYYVAEEFRGMHYAQSACMELFSIAREKGMKFVYIACEPGNIPSRKTCLAAGCTFEGIEALLEESELYHQGVRLQCVYKKELM